MNGLYIGVEIGASKHQICLADAAGKILKMDSGKVELEKGAAGILAWMKEHISAMIESRPAGSEIVAVAVGFGGIIDVYLLQHTVVGVHCCFPQLLGVHLTQTFVALCMNRIF